MGTVAAAPEITTGRAAEAGHWYNLLTGELIYEIRGANGKMRPPTLRDAKKYLEEGTLFLGPGITTVTKQLAAPQLTRWMVRQALMAAITLPRIAYESDDAFMARAEEDANEQAAKAAARGTEVHAGIQGSFEGQPVTPSDWPYVEPVRAWLAQRYGLDGWIAEKSLASLELGFGTKIDLANYGIPCIVDFKGKDHLAMVGKRGKDLAFWSHCMQLAAGRMLAGLPKADCVNIFFCRDVPHQPVIAREWDEPELQKGWRMFKHCLGLWQEEKDYYPHLKAAA